MSAKSGYAHESKLRRVPLSSNACRESAYSRSGAATGRGRNSSASIRRKAETQAPIASASDNTATVDVIRLRRSCRQPKNASARSPSSPPRTRDSRLASRWRSIGPNAFRASSASRPSPTASAMCASYSSSSSRFKRSPRKTLPIRVQSPISSLRLGCFLLSRFQQHPVDCRTDESPANLFRCKLFLARRGQLLNARPAPVLFRHPVGMNPACLLHPVQRRIERTLLRVQHLAGGLFNSGHYGVAMQLGAPRKNLQHQQVQRTLQRIWLSHTKIS